MKCEHGDGFIMIVPESSDDEQIVLELMSSNMECYLRRIRENSNVLGIRIQDKDKLQT